MKKLFHMYYCRDGCGETTLIGRKIRQRGKVFCGNCGKSTETFYVGDYKIEQQLKPTSLNK